MVSGDIKASGRDLEDTICRIPDLKKVLFKLARFRDGAVPRYV